MSANQSPTAPAAVSRSSQLDPNVWTDRASKASACRRVLNVDGERAILARPEDDPVRSMDAGEVAPGPPWHLSQAISTGTKFSIWRCDVSMRGYRLKQS